MTVVRACCALLVASTVCVMAAPVTRLLPGVPTPTLVLGVDVNFDGRTDIVTASDGDRTLGFYENTGFATYGDFAAFATDGVSAARAAAYADVDSDGLQDFVVVSNDGGPVFSVGNRVAWYRNLGAGQFGPQVTISTSQVRERASPRAAGCHGVILLPVRPGGTDGTLGW